MNSILLAFWNPHRKLDRLPYLLAGLILFAIKFALDWTVAAVLFDRSWSPLNYLIWPDDSTIRIFELPPADRTFSLTLLVLSTPFICAGLLLTARRLRAAQLSLVLLILFFVPVVNLLLFLVLIFLPTRADQASSAPPIVRIPAYPGASTPLLGPPRPADSTALWSSALTSLAITVSLGIALVVFGTRVLESYGFGLFVGVPFMIGVIASIVHGWASPRSSGQCALVSFAALTLSIVGLICVGVEGVICLIMFAPLAVLLTFVGSCVGYIVQARVGFGENRTFAWIAIALSFPGLMAAESANEPAPVVRAVSTSIVVDAPPERVWPHVIAFPPLPEPTPDEWLFRSGIAYPQRAEIDGTGVGAVRHCVFSTGTFVEPIEVWDPPHTLRFRVTDQPPPIHEWSPYDIHPPHLDHHLVSREGEFRLEPLPGGRTRLTGTTWCTNRMWPAVYWNRWSDAIIHRIHLRVLEHIRRQAQQE